MSENNEKTMLPRWNPESPTLLPTIVCYADILGYRDEMERAHESGIETEILWKIKNSLAEAYEPVRNAKTLGGLVDSVFDMKVFTDNIVVAYPLPWPDYSYGESQLGTILTLFAHVQAKLAADGFLLRGGIAFGDHYQDDDLVFGSAYLEALDLDKSGGSPRLVVAPSVEPLVSKHLKLYEDRSWAPLYDELLEDPRDKSLFINYLRSAFEEFPECDVDHKLLASHGKTARDGLNEHRSDPSVRAKYEWMATYHNYVCDAFADRYSNAGGEAADDEYQAAIAEAAQGALRHKVPCEVLESKLCPLPLDAQRLRQRIDCNPGFHLES